MGDKQKKDVKKAPAEKKPSSMERVGKLSKNQRATHAKQEQRVHLCVAGHKRVNVLIAGTGMRLLCECVGYQPINTSLPYKQRKAKIITSRTARIIYEEPSDQ